MKLQDVNRMNVVQARDVRIAEIKQLLARLEEKVDIEANREPSTVHWAHVGTLGHIAVELNDLVG